MKIISVIYKKNCEVDYELAKAKNFKRGFICIKNEPIHFSKIVYFNNADFYETAIT